MMDFLSDVFEFEVDAISDSVQRGPLFFKLFELEPQTPVIHNSPNNGVIFSFKVKSEQALKEIMSKYNFFLYRKSNANAIVEKLELFQSETTKILTISDIDQRLWRFEYDTRVDF
ncbi:MAG: hypothetical protein Q7U04_01435 [Bacteriovorax sp.]|nr:hypothetical protein [Bacteriovorax sp.]